MKKQKQYIYALLVVLLLLIANHYRIVSNSTDERGKFQLIGRVYLDRIDFFSKYNVVVKNDTMFHTIIDNIQELSVTDNYVVVKTERKNAESNFIIIDSLGQETKTEAFNYNNLEFSSPMSISNEVESRSSEKNIRLISFSLIATVFVVLLMVIFKIPKLNRN